MNLFLENIKMYLFFRVKPPTLTINIVEQNVQAIGMDVGFAMLLSWRHHSTNTNVAMPFLI